MEKRMSLTVSDKNRMDDLILIQFQQLQLPVLNLLHSYLSIDEKHEVPTDAILSFLEFRNPGMHITIPRINKETRSIESVLYDEQVLLQKHSWGIPEPVGGTVVDPKQIDMVLVPLLAFDNNGYRVGYGKGFYDEYLSRCREDVLKIGLSYFEAVDSITDTEQFDIPLNYTVTPHRIYEFG